MQSFIKYLRFFLSCVGSCVRSCPGVKSNPGPVPEHWATSANKGSDLLASSANNLSSASPTSGQLSVPAFLGRRSP